MCIRENVTASVETGFRSSIKAPLSQIYNHSSLAKKDVIWTANFFFSSFLRVSRQPVEWPTTNYSTKGMKKLEVRQHRL